MKHLRNGFYFGILLLMLLAAGCQMGTSTPVVLVPIGLVPTAIPTTLVLGPLGLKNPPACNPPVPSISDINSFCANQAAGLGGASFTDTTYLGNPSDNNGESHPYGPDNVNCNWQQGLDTGKYICSGPKNTKFQVVICALCVPPNQLTAVPGYVACSKGYMRDDQGNCNPIDPNQVYGLCPTGSHYDNGAQNCVDDVTDKLASPCPAGFPYYEPDDSHYCWNQSAANPAIYNCQTFNLQLGDCSVAPKQKSCGAPKSCSPGYSWSSKSCSCVCPSGHC